RGPQSWDRGAVSDPGLMLVVDDPQRPVQLRQEVALLVVDAGRAQGRDRLQPVDDVLLAVLVLLCLDEILLARVVVPLRDLLVHPLDRLLFPRLGARRAIQRLRGTERIVRELDRRRALRTETSQRARRAG